MIYPETSKFERERSISLLHFKWPKNISRFDRNRRSFGCGLFELCISLMQKQCFLSLSLASSAILAYGPKRCTFSHWRAALCSFDSFCLYIIHMYYDYYCFCFSFWTSEIITFNLNCILPHQRKHNFSA